MPKRSSDRENYKLRKIIQSLDNRLKNIENRRRPKKARRLTSSSSSSSELSRSVSPSHSGSSSDADGLGNQATNTGERAHVGRLLSISPVADGVEPLAAGRCFVHNNFVYGWGPAFFCIFMVLYVFVLMNIRKHSNDYAILKFLHLT